MLHIETAAAPVLILLNHVDRRHLLFFLSQAEPTLVEPRQEMPSQAGAAALKPVCPGRVNLEVGMGHCSCLPVKCLLPSTLVVRL